MHALLAASGGRGNRSGGDRTRVGALAGQGVVGIRINQIMDETVRNDKRWIRALDSCHLFLLPLDIRPTAGVVLICSTRSALSSQCERS